MSFTQRMRRDTSSPLPFFFCFGRLLPLHQTFWDLVSDFRPRRTMVQPVFSPCFLLCYSLDTSFRQTYQCRIIFPVLHPPSTTSFLITLRCLSVHDSLVFLRCMAWIGSIHTPSFSSSHSCFAAHSFWWTILACFCSIVFTSCGQTTFMSTTTHSKVCCHCGHLVPKSRGLAQ